MPISRTNPFEGRHYPGQVILSAVRWYRRCPLAYLHVSELLAERGLLVDASCIWRWCASVWVVSNVCRAAYLSVLVRMFQGGYYAAIPNKLRNGTRTCDLNPLQLDGPASLCFAKRTDHWLIGPDKSHVNDTAYTLCLTLTNTVDIMRQHSS